MHKKLGGFMCLYGSICLQDVVIISGYSDSVEYRAF